ncbi:testis-specific serine/threonine-protein kinase 6-like [Topomyia yanbarensis]|uniref:testis-specific serine/threonine-protein kinase 6-like n=1 Tax=Topomyia yanbarensis TaxID=2498891 RepID=UPI00273C337E|nr:testis-specific serine/threonine-protein kinase 6-like [Topomyia yanbarensis]
MSTKTGTSNELSPFASSSSVSRALNIHGYRIGAKIGKGSFSSVRLAKWVSKNQNVTTMACKVIDVRKGTEEFVKKFFPRELSVLMKVRHQHIVKIHSILKRERMVFIFMDYAEGGDLLKFINKNGALNETQAKLWFSQMVSAARYLHSIDIAHRDLKCENILLSKKGAVQLADFGFARVCGEQHGAFSETYCGSAAYAAPEVILGKPYNPMVSDVWSLGVILFVMLNAAMPFDDRNVKKLVEDHQNRNYKFEEPLLKQLSSAAIRTIYELLNPDPNERVKLDQLFDFKWIDENSAKEKRRKLSELCVKRKIVAGSVKTTTGCRC